jgi:hypothetical protein
VTTWVGSIYWLDTPDEGMIHGARNGTAQDFITLIISRRASRLALGSRGAGGVCYPAAPAALLGPLHASLLHCGRRPS